MKETTSEILKKLMDRHGHNAYDLEERSGVPQPTINRILTGKHGEPRKNTLDKLAKVYGLQAAHLRGEIPLDLTVETVGYVSNAHGIVPQSDIKKMLMELINATDNKKLSPLVISIIREILDADLTQMTTLQGVVHAVCQPVEQYHTKSRKNGNGE